MATPLYNLGMTSYIFLLSLLSVSLYAKDEPPALSPKTPVEGPYPIVSDSGMQRVQNNIAVLGDNIKEVQKSIAATEHNVKVILDELDELKKLEEEHQHLKQKVQDYLNASNQEVSKNDELMKQLEELERGVSVGTRQVASKGEEKALQNRTETIRLEKAEREKWTADAGAKIKRVGALINDIDENIKEIEARKKPLQAQLREWTGRREEYKQVLSQFNHKLEFWQRIAQKQPYKDYTP